MSNDNDVIHRNLVRQARPPGMGPSTSALNSMVAATGVAFSDVVVAEDGSVRRRWTPGDPWDSHYYFGSRGN